MHGPGERHLPGTTKPVAGSTFYPLLALADRERYGLGIVQEVERRTDGAVKLGPGTLYNTIKKLLDDGRIEEADDVAHAGDDPRRRSGALAAELTRGSLHAAARR